MGKHIDRTGIKPAGYDRGDARWAETDVAKLVNERLHNSDYFQAREKDMVRAMEESAKVVDEMATRLLKSTDRLVEREKQLSDSTKKVSSQVRQNTDKLQGALSNMEKVANFERLERYVEILERAASAIQVISELEQGGKLERIIQAMR